MNCYYCGKRITNEKICPNCGLATIGYTYNYLIFYVLIIPLMVIIYAFFSDVQYMAIYSLVLIFVSILVLVKSLVFLFIKSGSARRKNYIISFLETCIILIGTNEALRYSLFLMELIKDYFVIEIILSLIVGVLFALKIKEQNFIKLKGVVGVGTAIAFVVTRFVLPNMHLEFENFLFPLCFDVLTACWAFLFANFSRKNLKLWWDISEE